jgi:hypothetical protein
MRNFDPPVEEWSEGTSKQILSNGIEIFSRPDLLSRLCQAHNGATMLYQYDGYQRLCDVVYGGIIL